MKRHIGKAFPAAILCLLIAPSCPAYLDPGTGSIILQSLIAGVAAAMFVVRLYWAKLKHFFLTVILRRADNRDAKEASGLQASADSEN